MRGDRQTPEIWQVIVTSPHTRSERQIDVRWKLGYLKEKLEHITGISPEFQDLIVSNSAGAVVPCTDSRDASDIKNAYGVNGDHWQIEVEDTRPAHQQPDFSGSVDKFELPLGAYEQRSDSVLAWKKKHYLGRFSTDPRPVTTSPAPEPEDATAHLAAGMPCTVQLASGAAVAGTVRFMGHVPEIPGNRVWVGVELRTPKGKNDGSIKGARYFEAHEKHGIFVRPTAVIPGDDEDDEV